MADLTNAQKKEWAKTLYLKENLTQQEICLLYTSDAADD